MKALTIGVAGGSGSGKMTVSQAILQSVGADRISYIVHDWYYLDQSHLPLDERRHINYDHPNSLDTALLIKHLRQLRVGRAIDAPTYDFATYCRSADTLLVKPNPVIMVEGILIFAEPELRHMMDIKIFVDTDPDIRFIRRLVRDVQERGRSVNAVIHQYISSVRPMHIEFVEPSRRYADVIIPQGGFNTVALDMVVARVQAMLIRYA